MAEPPPESSAMATRVDQTQLLMIVVDADLSISGIGAPPIARTSFQA
jgi:hypothetical protein